MSRVVFTTQNKGTFGLPNVTTVIMLAVFSMPVLVLPMLPWRDLATNPWLVVMVPISLFPLSVLYVLRRFMTRYALRVFEDGAADIVYPFKTVHFATGQLREVVVQKKFVAAVDAYRTWIQFIDSEERIVATLSPNAFESDLLNQFLAELQASNPNLIVRST